MKTIIAGSRDGATIEDVRAAIASCPWQITSVVSGCARGVDRFGEQIAEEMGLHVYRVPANWEMYGKGAGPVRNSMMALQSEALIAVWDGQSRGTKNMIETAVKTGLLIHVHMLTGSSRRS